MTLSNSIRKVYSNYLNFSGRASRSEFWWFWLYTFVIGGILGYFANTCDNGFGTLMSILSALFYLVNIIPAIAVAVRRLHDTGRGGGWIFISLIPVIGTIWYLVLVLLPSEPDNRFGATPRD